MPDGTAPGRISARNFRKSLAAMAIAQAYGTRPSSIVESRFGDDAALKLAVELIQRSVTDPASTTQSGWAAQLVNVMVAEFVATMPANSAFRQLRGLAHSFDFQPGGQLGLPSLQGDVQAAQWIGELAAIPITAGQLGLGTLARHKVAAISVATREIVDASANQIGRVIEMLHGEAAARALDERLTSDLPAVAGAAPPGLAAGISPTPSAGDAASDLSLLFQAAAKYRVPAILISPERLANLWSDVAFNGGLYSGRLGPCALIATPFAADPELVLVVDASRLAIASSLPIITPSDVALLMMENGDATAPTHWADSAGAISTGPADVIPPRGGLALSTTGPAAGATPPPSAVNVWQIDSIAQKMVAEANWRMLAPGFVSAVSGASW